MDDMYDGDSKTQYEYQTQRSHRSTILAPLPALAVIYRTRRTTPCHVRARAQGVHIVSRFRNRQHSM